MRIQLTKIELFSIAKYLLLVGVLLFAFGGGIAYERRVDPVKVRIDALNRELPQLTRTILEGRK